MKNRKMISGLIYRMKRTCFHYSKKYPCAIPEPYANDSLIGDCTLCDENGSIDENNACPVPVCIDQLGEIIGKAE